MSDLLLLSDFEPWLHQIWWIQFTEEVRMSSVLIEANKINTYSPAPREPFSIVLRTEQKTEYFPQAVRILHHPEKGEIPVFLVPLGDNGDGMRYEAIFA
jgi:hypothetical protein